MKLLFIAYKIEKNKGSEDGTGYHVAELLAQKDIELTIITRQNNIDKLKFDPKFSHIRFIPVEVPKYLSFYKKKNRGIILYYYLWMILVGFQVKKLQKLLEFDVIHQFNFHATWAPHFIFSKAKIIWGPLTHHPLVPFSFWQKNRLNFIGEFLRFVIKHLFFYCDPFLKWAVKRADHIFLGYPDYIGPYKTYQSKTSLLPQAATLFSIIDNKIVQEQFNLLFVGRFVTLKNCLVVLSAFEKMLLTLSSEQQRKTSLTMVGDGYLLDEINSIAQRIAKNTKTHIQILPWQEQQSLADHYLRSALFVFPSFEGQGLVVVEAMAHGCPVLCLADTGPSFLAGNAAITVEKNSFSIVVQAMALQLEYLYNEYFNNPALYQKRIEKALTSARKLTWKNKVDRLMDVYNDQL